MFWFQHLVAAKVDSLAEKYICLYENKLKMIISMNLRLYLNIQILFYVHISYALESWNSDASAFLKAVAVHQKRFLKR